MTTITIDTVEYNIPEAWNEITLEQFIKFMDLAATGSNQFQILYRVCAFCGLELEKGKRMNPKFLEEFLTRLSFLNEEPVLAPVYEFKHNGIDYTVMDHILNGQTQDFISLMSIEKDNEANPYKGLPMKLAILAKRKTTSTNLPETIDDYDIQSRANEFLSLPITIVKAVDGFFLSAAMMSSLDSRNFLKSQNELINLLVESSIDSLKTPAGTHWFGRWLMKMLQKYLWFIGRGWSKYYSTIS